MHRNLHGHAICMTVLIVLFVLLFLLLFLSMPLTLEVRIRVGFRAAAVRAKLYVLGLIPIPVRLRVHLFSEPYFTLQIGKKEVPLFKQKPRGGELGILKGVRLLWLSTVTTVGIADDPARAVLTAGTIATLLAMLTARYAESGRALARPTETSMLRLSVSASALLFPAEMLAGFWCAWRIAKKKAANTIRKQEKRNQYASG